MRAAKTLPGELLAVARRSSGYFAVFTQETEHENLENRPFVRIVSLTAKGEPKSEEPWQLLKRAQVSRWRMLHQAEEFASLELDTSRGSLLTDEEVQDTIEQCQAMYPDDELLSVRVGRINRYGSRPLQYVEGWWLSTVDRHDRLGRVTFKAGDAELRRRNFEVAGSTIVGGFKFYRDNVKLERRENFRDQGFTYPWEGGGDVKLKHEVFHDQDVAQKSKVFADAASARQRDERAGSNFASRLARVADELVTAEHEAELLARYVDDYGTEIGYAEWRTGIKVTGRRLNGLSGRLIADISNGRAIGGRRLGDLYPDFELWAAAEYVIPAPVGGSAA